MIPGFVAEASMNSGSKFTGRWSSSPVVNGVGPAQLHCDEVCLDNCLLDPSDCDDLPNAQARARCRAFILRHNAGCRRRCCHF